MTDPAVARPGESVVVLGAGVAGCAAALVLVRRGFRVTVVDRGPPGSGCSHGNAGGIVPQAAPLAQPGLPWKVPGMLFARTGPLSIRPARLFGGMAWFVRFLQECTAHRAESNSRALYALSGHAAPAWKFLLRGTAGADMIRDVGWLKVFSGDPAFFSHAKDRAFLDRRGAPYEILTQDELRQLEPNLAPIFKYGVRQLDGPFVVNPRRLVETLVEEAQSLGTMFLQETAISVSVLDDGRITLQTEARTHGPDRLVLCASAFSARFARQLGANPRLEAERGYHAMFDIPERGVNRPVLWYENGMVLCPMEHGYRLTTQAEFAGLGRGPDYTRLNRLIPKAADLLPGLDTTVRDRWMGHRPSTPDSLPYLGMAPATPRAYFNFGHNHLGLTLAAISAQIMAAHWTANAGESLPDMTAYRAIR